MTTGHSPTYSHKLGMLLVGVSLMGSNSGHSNAALDFRTLVTVSLKENFMTQASNTKKIQRGAEKIEI